MSIWWLQVRVTVRTAKCTAARVIMEQEVVRLPAYQGQEEQVHPNLAHSPVPSSERILPSKHPGWNLFKLPFVVCVWAMKAGLSAGFLLSLSALHSYALSAVHCELVCFLYAGFSVVAEQGISAVDIELPIGSQVVLSATAVVVSLDAQYKPKRISAALRERLMSGAAHPEDHVDVGLLD